MFSISFYCPSSTVEKIKSTVQKLQTGISSMEMEKKNIEGTIRLDHQFARAK